MFSRKVIISMLALAMFGGVGCGNKNNPAPPPPPQINNPSPNGGGFIGGGNCGGLSGQPLNNGVPFTATLTGPYGTSGNSISLTLANPANGAGYGYTSALVGNAQMVLPDLQQMFQMYVQQYSFCVSSVDQTSGAVNTGSLTGGTYVQLSMSTILSVPSYSYAPPGFPGSQNNSPMPIYVDVGTACQTYIQNNRLIGCVSVSYGQRGSNPQVYSTDGNQYGGGYGGYQDPYGYGNGYGNYGGGFY